ncbi:MAG: response regulator [Candidatus Aureabacteria bacterium]|nr:response regulator [Candidatus Auribacterota bacterium]
MTYRILVVDDEPAIVKILETFLAKMGFEVITALGGEKAVEILRSDIKADLIILDMKMPKIKGLDVLQEMKRINKRIPVIILSGSLGTKSYRKQLKNMGCPQLFEYLIKPVDLGQLLDAIKKIQNQNLKA